MLAHVELYQWSSGPYSQDFTASKWLGWKCSFNMDSSFGTQNLRMKPNSRTWASCSHQKGRLGGLALWMLGWAFSLGEAWGCWYCWLFSWLCLEYRLIQYHITWTCPKRCQLGPPWVSTFTSRFGWVDKTVTSDLGREQCQHASGNNVIVHSMAWTWDGSWLQVELCLYNQGASHH